MAKLIVYEEIEGAETIFEDFELVINRILIGSGPDNHLVLDTPEIDSAHASLELRNQQWILQDLGGPGGTLVNEQSINGPHFLDHNDLIQLGLVKLRFVDDVPEVLIEEEEADTIEQKESGSAISGRVWLTAMAGGTLAVIFIILFLLIVADLLDVIKIADLLPWG